MIIRVYWYVEEEIDPLEESCNLYNRGKNTWSEDNDQ